jgi:transcriptional regulator with GAF, ATPase, and Fis domain
VPLESVITTSDLDKRPRRSPDYARENQALVALATALAASPSDILPKLSQAALQLCGAHSAGFSLLDRDRKRFHWTAVAGEWASHVGGGTPREFGPCGTVLDFGTPLLFSHPERHFKYLAATTPCIVEGLLLPFAVGGDALGTMWIISHDARRRFDHEDLRLMMSLSRFASAAYCCRESIRELAVTNDELRRTALALRHAHDLAEKLTQENLYLETELRAEGAFGDIVGNSAILRDVLRQVETVAPTDATVLILGETGTGKELIARAIHASGARRGQPFVKINCAAIPAGLAESELFGHEKGAFTGAISRKLGRFELAHRGTLFLDEVGDIPFELQPKLLHALQEQEFHRLGSADTVRVAARIIAATNRNLTEMVDNGSFRQDLFYRLNVFPVTVPPLRERREDIPALVRYFVKKHAVRMSRVIEAIPRGAMDALVSWDWPGNIRELSHAIERAVIMSPARTLIIPRMDAPTAAKPTATEATLNGVTRAAIVRALRESGGTIGGPRGAAVKLGVKRTTLAAKMRKLGISRRHS